MDEYLKQIEPLYVANAAKYNKHIEDAFFNETTIRLENLSVDKYGKSTCTHDGATITIEVNINTHVKPQMIKFKSKDIRELWWGIDMEYTQEMIDLYHVYRLGEILTNTCTGYKSFPYLY